MAEELEARGADIKTHWRHATEVFRSKGFLVGPAMRRVATATTCRAT